MMTQREIIEAQSQYVVMGNELIQKSRYDLSKHEQKLLLYMVSKIKPTDTPDTEYIFRFDEFESVCNLNKNGGYYKKSTEDALYHLKTKPLKLIIDEDTTLITSWFNEAVIDKKSQCVRISFPKYLSPYLFNLKAFMFKSRLCNMLPMDTKYSIRLYEYLKDIRSKGYKQVITLDTLRERTESTQYTKFKDFRVRVLEPALYEINTYSDLTVSYKPLKTGKMITALEVLIKSEDTAEKYINRARALGTLPAVDEYRTIGGEE